MSAAADRLDHQLRMIARGAGYMRHAIKTMSDRGQSLDPHDVTFSENFIHALDEQRPGFSEYEARKRAVLNGEFQQGQSSPTPASANAAASIGRAAPSIGKARPRQDASAFQTPDTQRKPNESREEYYARIKRQLQQAQDRAPTGTGSGQARGLNVSSGAYDRAGYSEKSEGNYAVAKRKLLASEEAKVREIQHHAETAGSTIRAESGTLRDKALARMKTKGEPTDPKSGDFHENYRRALKEVRA